MGAYLTKGNVYNQGLTIWRSVIGNGDESTNSRTARGSGFPLVKSERMWGSGLIEIKRAHDQMYGWVFD